MSQKDIFLSSEADAWFKRNKVAASEIDFSNDSVAASVLEVVGCPTNGLITDRLKILEIGYGEGRRLQWLSERMSADVFGVAPLLWR